MHLIIKNIASKKDLLFLSKLLKRLGLKSVLLTVEWKEDIAMSLAIQDGIKSGYADEKEIMKTLRQVKCK